MWQLHTFRIIIYVFIALSLYCNVSDCFYLSNMSITYWECKECGFVRYEVVVMCVSFLSMIGLIAAIPLVAAQDVLALRFHIMVFFLTTWLHMMVLFVLTQRYPLTRVIHDKWLRHSSLSYYEENFECCGKIGPDDYDEIPLSCYKNNIVSDRNLYKTGCLVKKDVCDSVLRIEMITVVFQHMLVVLLLVYRMYLINIDAPIREIGFITITRARTDPLL